MGLPETIANLPPLYHVRAQGSNAASGRFNVIRPNSLQQNGNLNPESAAPRLWVLASPHSGDNTQLLALAEGLAWPFEVKRLVYRRFEEGLRTLKLPTLVGVDLGASSPITPPWPDLVICAGRGAEAVAFWIRRNGNPKLRMVFIGTPWANPAKFDLVITTPQYGLPEAANTLRNDLPVHGVTPQKIAIEAARWRSRLAHLPEPRIALLAGGRSGPYLFKAETAAQLGAEISDLAKSLGGSLLVTTSARTGAPATQALAAAIAVPHYFHRWEKDRADNPFLGFLGHSDRIVVTADSISMLAEACATEKPVWLYDIEHGPQAMRAEEGKAGRQGRMPPIHWRGHSLDTTVFRLLMNVAPVRFSRDLRIVHRRLIATGQVSWFGEAPNSFRREPQQALERSVTRIRQLFGL